MIFLNEEDFVYDPNYEHWKQLTESRVLQFEPDTTSTKDKKKTF